jgi:hypothetical protein
LLLTGKEAKTPGQLKEDWPLTKKQTGSLLPGSPAVAKEDP